MKIAVTEEAMKNLQPGDVVHFRCGGKATIAKMTVIDGISAYFINCVFVGYSTQNYFTSTGMSHIGQTSPEDIIAIEKAVVIPEGFTAWIYPTIPNKRSGELWCVVFYSDDEYNFAICLSLELAILHAKKFPKIVIAIFNPFLTGGKWTEGDGLELLGK